MRHRLTAPTFAPLTMEKSSPLTPKSQPRWGHYPILPSPITRGNAASTNTLTASSGSTSQKVPTSLFCPMPMSKGSRTNSTLAPERYSATKPLARFSSAPEICPLHFTVEWAIYNVGPNQSNRDCAAGCRRVSDGGTGAAESRPRPLCVFGPDNFVLVGLICGRSPASCAGPPVTRSLPVQTPMARLRRRPASHIRKGHLFRQTARRGSRRAVWVL